MTSHRLLCTAMVGAGLVLAACASPGFTGSSLIRSYLSPAAQAQLPTAPARYLGVYEPGAPRKMSDIARFTSEIGRQPNLLLYYSTWGQPFAQGFAQQALAEGAGLVVQLDPGATPVAAIAAGRYDAYLRSFALQVRHFGHPLVMGFAREMNGRWYPWGWGHVSPRTWVAAWRRVVTVFRHAGARNVTWQWTVNDITGGVADPRRWWPGSGYVTWVGIDGYYYHRWDTFDSVFGTTLQVVRRFADKPILLSEVSMAPGTDPAQHMPALFAALRSRHLLGLEWFDAPARRDWRLENDPPALAAFRAQVRELPPLARLFEPSIPISASPSGATHD